jgi:hypothetical protein
LSQSGRKGDKVLARAVMEIASDFPPLFVLQLQKATRKPFYFFFRSFAVGDVTNGA